MRTTNPLTSCFYSTSNGTVVYSIIKKIMMFLKSNSDSSDINTNYNRNHIKKSKKRDIVDADFEEIKDKKQ